MRKISGYFNYIFLSIVSFIRNVGKSSIVTLMLLITVLVQQYALHREHDTKEQVHKDFVTLNVATTRDTMIGAFRFFESYYDSTAEERAKNFHIIIDRQDSIMKRQTIIISDLKIVIENQKKIIDNQKELLNDTEN